MTFSNVRRFRKKDLEELFLSVGWESGKYPKELKKAIRKSERVVSCWEYGKLIGLMSAVSDKGMNVFFPYLLVRPEYQKSGIGRKLCSTMLKHYKNCYRKILCCYVDKYPFYEKMGFRTDDELMAVMIVKE